MKISLTMEALSEAAAFAIGFVNTYDPMRDPVDLLADRAEATRFLGGHLEEGEVAEEVGPALIKHRDRLRAAFKAVAGGQQGAASQEVRFYGLTNVGWTMSLSEDGELVMRIEAGVPAVQRLEAWSTIGFLALTKHAPDRLRVCQSAPCEEVFQDETKAGRQKFCSKRCNTRFNVAQHRARERGERSRPVK